MASANDYLFSRDHCKYLAEESFDPDVRKAWDNLANSYELLLTLEALVNCEDARPPVIDAAPTTFAQNQHNQLPRKADATLLFRPARR